MTKLRVKIIKPRIPKYCICPVCESKQTFKKKDEHWKTVKDFHLDKPVLLKVLVVSAKCLNPHCKIKSFPLPVKGITKCQRATNRVIKEGIASNVLDNTPPEKIKRRFARSFNITGSRRTLDYWKHKEADKLNFKDLIRKLEPSRVICLDDLNPERATRTHLITSDRIKGYILYLDALLDQSEEEVVKYLTILKGLGINEVTCFIVDMWKSFPPAIHKVYPEAKIQYDYFHIWETVNHHLDNAMKNYSRYLRYTGFPKLAKRVWRYRRTFLKHPKRYTEKDKKIMDEIILSCEQKLPANILVLKDRIRDIFENSLSQDEVYEKKNKLYFESWHKKNRHFKKIIKLFMTIPVYEQGLSRVEKNTRYSLTSFGKGFKGSRNQGVEGNFFSRELINALSILSTSLNSSNTFSRSFFFM